MVILGISGLYHDSAAAIVRDGDIVAAAQEERFTRVKLDRSLPRHAIDYCLREAGGSHGPLRGAELDAVVYYDDPVAALHRTLANASAVRQDARDLASLSQFASGSLFGEKMWIETLLREHLGQLGREDRLFVTRHHMAHAASAFYPSPFGRAAVITVDGVGEWNTTTIGAGRGSRIELVKKIDYPHSLGLLYSAFTYFCGFRVNYGDYKLMGLAPYGEPVYADLIRRKIIDIKEDGSFRLDLHYFDFQNGRAMTNEAFAGLFGGPRRQPEAQITRREMDIAASAQAVTEEIMLRLARTAKRLTGEKDLVMAGGVALNCVANGRIAAEGIFDRIWVQPAAGDAGGALGAALACYYGHFGAPRPGTDAENGSDGMHGAFLGPSYSGQEVRDFLRERDLPYREFGSVQALYDEAAAMLEAQKVIGLFSGRMEYGPRALGHRSIIADPRSETMQARLNLSIKYRESFRPFAPAVLRERCGEYFGPLGDSTAPWRGDSPYMLFCGTVRDREDEDFALREHLAADPDMLSVINRRRSSVPAVTHVDYSARIQTVDRETDPFFYGIISAFEKRTGCPVVINTSFNVRGEPIVCTPEDAYRCFMNTQMDALILEDVILYREEQPERERRRETFAPD